MRAIFGVRITAVGHWGWHPPAGWRGRRLGVYKGFQSMPSIALTAIEKVTFS